MTSYLSLLLLDYLIDYGGELKLQGVGGLCVLDIYFFFLPIQSKKLFFLWYYIHLRVRGMQMKIEYAKRGN